ncbi:MAG: N-acetylneuraminate synthase family protein [Acidimicrobiales bacterium]
MSSTTPAQAPSMEIGGKTIGEGNPCFVIAEAGVNHDGDLQKAYELVHAAADAGADAVKFQTFDPDALTTRDAPAAEYQTETVGATDQHSMLAKLTLPAEAWAALAAEAADRGLIFMSTPFDITSMRNLVSAGMPAIKISSGDITNHLLLRAAGALGVPVILSTGGSTYDEVARALDALSAAPSVAVLHCVTAYPSPLEESNLHVIPTLASRFDCVAGWSDHTVGHDSAIMAIAIGANIIEKHLTLDSTAAGPDHRASADPTTMTAYMRAIRSAERALGNGEKQPTNAETANRLLVRRSLFAARSLPAGTVLGDDDLTALRPASGLSADTPFVGRVTTRALAQGEALLASDLADAGDVDQ